MKKTETLISDFDFEIPLEDLVEKITGLKDKYSSFSNLRFNKDWAQDYHYYELLGDREETEQEIAYRKQVEENRVYAHKERIRKEAEKLGLL